MSVGKPSYKAAGSIRELRITVCQYPERTRLGISWSTRERGDDVGEGSHYAFQHEDTKPIKSFGHALNLAGWLVRRALAGGMTQTRGKPSQPH
jgi:hypothetical protein